MRLARLGEELLESRAQAKRLVAGFEQFETVELDVDGVPGIGQAFADALFRVFADRHPGVALRSRNMNDGVAGPARQGGAAGCLRQHLAGGPQGCPKFP